MAAAVGILVSLFLMLHFSREDDSSPISLVIPSMSLEPPQKSGGDSFHTFMLLINMSPQSLISLLLLALTIVLSGSIYLWVLRYICIGCCQPVPFGTESETLAGIV